MMIGVADALSDGTADGGLLDGIHEQSIADENVEHKRSAVSIPVCVRARACVRVCVLTPVRQYGGTRVVRHCTARIASVAHRQSRTLFVACSLRSMTSWPVCQVTCVVHRMLHVPRSMLRYLGCASVGFRPPYQCAQSSPVVSHSNADEITCRATPGSVRKAKPGSGPQVSS